MGIESSFNYIDDLDSANPATGDNVSQGDDHLRGIKSAVKGSFPSLGSAAVNATASELNVLSGVTAFLDEDDMASNSATAIASQQSIRQYHRQINVATVSGAVTIDCDGGFVQYLTASGNITSMTCSNTGAGKRFTVIIEALTPGNKTLVYNASWRLMGSYPTTITAGRFLRLEFTLLGVGDSAVVVSGAELEP